jgi:Flp pilus assembly protein TadD
MNAEDPRLRQWLGQALQAQQEGRFGPALLGYRRVVAAFPDQIDAWCNLSAVLRELNRVEEAEAAGRRAVDLAPDEPMALVNLGLALLALGDAAGADRHLTRAADLAPANPVVLANLALLRQAQGRDLDALDLDVRALEAAPDHVDLALNLGHSLLRLGRLPEAESRFQRILTRLPDHAKARWNLAYTRLLRGAFREAWPTFPARLEMPETRENLRPFPQPRWGGEPFAGRTLLVWGEQGYGDNLMAVRFLPRVKALGGRVILLSYAPILDLLRTAGGADVWLAEGEDLPPFDLQTPLLDLPALLDCGAEDLASSPSTLRVPPGYTPPVGLRASLDVGSGPRVGLVWAGNPRHVEDRWRSLDPQLLAPLAGLEGIAWFSLQVPEAPPPPLPNLVSLAPHLHSFTDTAWALERLDAVISVDTAVAHLAGCLARPVHLLLPFFPDWRWGLQGSRTPWYPTLTLHRQSAAGAWGDVIASLAEVLPRSLCGT